MRCLLLLLTVCCILSSTIWANDEVLIEDFESPDYGCWVIQGEAFGSGPAKGTMPDQNLVNGFLGKGLVNSFFNGDRAQGTLTSPQFRIVRPYINFLVGGGNHPGRTCINLIVDDKVARTATGSNSEELMWHSWDVSELKDKTARVQIVDRHSGGWGHINVDQISQSWENKMENRMLIPPVYHFRPADGSRMGDPHPFYYDGVYHIFYQAWYHARSEDLIDWEYLPKALEVSKEKGEDTLLSGCAVVNDKGRAMIFYTSIGWGKTAKEYAYIWAAVGNDNLVSWTKHPANPLLNEKMHGSVKIWDWRDPFIFHHQGSTFMVVGGHLTPAPKWGRATVELYRAKNEELTKWEYMGILFEDSEPASGNIECPFFFKDGDVWVLGISTFRGVEYLTGSFDGKIGRFTPIRRGWIESSRKHFYAPSCTVDDKGRCIMWGWIQGVRDWKGCLTVPRVLTVSDDGHLIQMPAMQLQKLRGRHYTASDISLANSSKTLEVKGDALEIIVEFAPGNAASFGLKLRCSDDGIRAAAISYDGKELDVNGLKTSFKLFDKEKTLKLHVFLDKSVMEVFVNDGRMCVTRVIFTGEKDLGLKVFANGGSTTIESIDVWQMNSIEYAYKTVR